MSTLDGGYVYRGDPALVALNQQIMARRVPRQIGPQPTREIMFRHGMSGYTNRGCRCETCTAANTEHCRQRRARRARGFNA